MGSFGVKMEKSEALCSFVSVGR